MAVEGDHVVGLGQDQGRARDPVAHRDPPIAQRGVQRVAGEDAGAGEDPPHPLGLGPRLPLLGIASGGFEPAGDASTGHGSWPWAQVRWRPPFNRRARALRNDYISPLFAIDQPDDRSRAALQDI